MTLREPSAARLIILFALLSCTAAGRIHARSIGSEDVMPEAVGKVLRAQHTRGALIKIDGFLNERVWNRAEEYYDFAQSEPEYGFAPSEQTEVKILYDNEAVYIGVQAFDSRPDLITGLLTRRDEFSDSDWITVYIDSRHDRQSAYGFSVNPYGVKVDYFYFSDVRMDRSWDAVWQAEARIDSMGWTVEFKIPYSALRFSPDKKLVWGFNMRRVIKRKQERDYWVLRPRGASGFVSRFGQLVGIGDIDPPRRFEILPYVVGRRTTEPADPVKNPDGLSTYQGLGSDFKIGLGPAITLDAAVNPDFGQVEDDPAVLNLSVYETFFPERRPFFLEGANIFDTPFMLFHSRRIGRRPGRYSIGEDDEEVDRPDFSTILGAAKVSGRTGNGTAFGVLDAVTDREFAEVDSIIEDGDGTGYRIRRQRLIEPRSNYFVGRVRQDLLRGGSYIGAMATALNRRHDDAAYTGGVDWQLRTYNNAYSVSGQLALSRVEENENPDGYAAVLSLDKRGGRLFRTGLDFEYISTHFDPNDLGFLRRNDRIDLSSYLRLLQLDPWSIFQSSDQSIYYRYAWNTAGLVTQRSLGLYTNFYFRNFYRLDLDCYRSFSDYDDLETRGGPVIRDPAGYGASLRLVSDDRHAVQFHLRGGLGSGDSGSWSRYLTVDMSVKPLSNVWFSINPRFVRSYSNSQWVENVDDDDDGIEDHFVFGELDRNTFDLELRTNITLTRDLSIQFFMQPYISAGRYNAFKELAEPGTYSFETYLFENPDFDFNVKSLKSNAVLRWEYLPGSTLFLVWTQSRDDDAYAGDFDLGRDFKRAFTGDGTDILLLKLNYWFNI